MNVRNEHHLPRCRAGTDVVESLLSAGKCVACSVCLLPLQEFLLRAPSQIQQGKNILGSSCSPRERNPMEWGPGILQANLQVHPGLSTYSQKCCLLRHALGLQSEMGPHQVETTSSSWYGEVHPPVKSAGELLKKSLYIGHLSRGGIMYGPSK